MPRRPLDGARRITGNAASHAAYNVGPATDYGADMREVVRAPFSGWVTRWWSTTGGYTVAITNNQAKFTLQHMSAYAGKSAGQVNEGDVIGYVGNTGTATTGPHVHCWIVLVESGSRISFEQYLVNQGWTTAPLWGSVPGPFASSTAGSPGTTIPATPTESDEDMPQYDLIQTTDGTVWWSVDRIFRYAIPNQSALDGYKEFYKAKTNFTAKVIAKTDAEADAYGSPVFANPLSRYATPANVNSSTANILAAVGTGGTGGGVDVSVNLQPVLDAISGIPAAVRTNLIME